MTPYPIHGDGFDRAGAESWPPEVTRLVTFGSPGTGPDPGGAKSVGKPTTFLLNNCMFSSSR
jgi:hypothetical protein